MTGLHTATSMKKPGLMISKESFTGGMATVYRVRDIFSGEDLALKVLNANLSEEPAFECLRNHLLRENVIEFVRISSINARLLHELGKEQNLFREDQARFTLVANPKTQAME